MKLRMSVLNSQMTGIRWPSSLVHQWPSHEPSSFTGRSLVAVRGARGSRKSTLTTRKEFASQ